MFETQSRPHHREWWENQTYVPAYQEPDTDRHLRRVAGLTVLLARHMNVPETDLAYIYRGALLHDIGMRGVPTNILLKPDLLSDEDWEIVRQHPIFGRRMLEGTNYGHHAVIDIPNCHHEKWDGSGYPYGLEGIEIPFAARLFAVADVWDALTSDKPYRAAWSWAEATAYVEEQAGQHFDPAIVDVFFVKIAPGLRE